MEPKHFMYQKSFTYQNVNGKEHYSGTETKYLNGKTFERALTDSEIKTLIGKKFYEYSFPLNYDETASQISKHNGKSFRFR